MVDFSRTECETERRGKIMYRPATCNDPNGQAFTCTIPLRKRHCFPGNQAIPDKKDHIHPERTLIAAHITGASKPSSLPGVEQYDAENPLS
jgi:hypothetical protein